MEMVVETLCLFGYRFGPLVNHSDFEISSTLTAQAV
jgi:hypothetical protein